MTQQSIPLYPAFLRVSCRASAMAALVLVASVPGLVSAQGVTPPTPPTPTRPAAPPAPPKKPVSVTLSRVLRPEGYIGIVYSGEQRMQGSYRRHNDRVVEQNLLVSYARYPVIVSVEPGSPAERAGLTAGDTVLSYNGKDVVSEPFPLYDMLKPGARLNMRVRRNNAVRTVAVTVGRRPAHAAVVGVTGQLSMFSPEIATEVRREMERAEAEMRKSLSGKRELTAAQRAQLERSVETAARAVAVAPMTFWTGAPSGVAGAEMTPLNDDLADLVGLRRGVFVVKVNPGTPADQSGLRGGDVITAVGDSTVSDVSQLRRAITAEQRRIRSRTGAREIELQIVRKHRRQKLTLRQ
jgi:C-terminal processing protease CtpA/Prc